MMPGGLQEIFDERPCRLVLMPLPICPVCKSTNDIEGSSCKCGNPCSCRLSCRKCRVEWGHDLVPKEQRWRKQD